MPEETVATTETTETTTTVPLVDDKGNLREGWQEIVDEKYRDDPYLKQVKNLQGLASSTVSARSMVGKDKMVRPNENSSDEDWEAFHVAGGRPETSADYNLARPEDFPEEHWNAALALSAQDLFHKIGLSSKQAAALMEFNNANVLTALKDQTDIIMKYQQESQDSLFNRWGAAYEQRKHWSNFGIEKGVRENEELKQRLLNLPLEGGGRLGDNADFVESYANVGESFREHGDVSASHIPTPGDIQTQIDEIMAKPAYTNEKLPGHDDLVKQVQDLYQEKNRPINR